MNLLEMKKKVLGLIEELNPQSDLLTDDPDVSAKLNEVINQVMFEMARFKKIPRYVEIEVTAGDTVTFETIEKICGNEVLQIDRVCGVRSIQKASGTVLKILDSGTAEIDFFVYPERITEKTKDKAYEFELSNDALEIMPYGIAGDLLKSDVSTDYGSLYTARYNEQLQRLDSRYHMATFYIDGGIDI